MLALNQLSKAAGPKFQCTRIHTSVIYALFPSGTQLGWNRYLTTSIVVPGQRKKHACSVPILEQFACYFLPFSICSVKWRWGCECQDGSGRLLLVSSENFVLLICINLALAVLESELLW